MISKKEQLRRQRISEGLKRHYVNKKRMEATQKKRRAAVKGLETKFRKRMTGCVVVFSGSEYAFFDKVKHPSARALQDKLNLFPKGKYIIKANVWLGIRHEDGSVDVISGVGDTDPTELIFDSRLEHLEFWRNYYTTIRNYLEEHAPKGDKKYDTADIQLRELQVC